MSYSLNIKRGGVLPIIDETNYMQLAPPSRRVLINGEWRYNAVKPRRRPPGTLPYAAPPNFPITPRGEWDALIAQLDTRKATIRHLSDRSGPAGKPIPSKDQNGTNFCHANSPAYIIELLRAKQNQPYIEMSAASIANPITGGQNAGAYIDDDLEQIVKAGCCDVKLYPANFVGLSKWTAEAKANAALHKVVEWWDMMPDDRMFDRVATLVLQGVPVAVAYNWWSHAVTAVGLVKVDGRYGLLCRNSWGGGYGDNGFFVLMEGKGTPDEAYAPRVVFASAA